MPVIPVVSENRNLKWLNSLKQKNLCISFSHVIVLMVVIVELGHICPKILCLGSTTEYVKKILIFVKSSLSIP